MCCWHICTSSARVAPFAAHLTFSVLVQELAARMRADIPALRSFHPTESNAIDYHRSRGAACLLPQTLQTRSASCTSLPRRC